jgi:micrococcal nuclease
VALLLVVTAVACSGTSSLRATGEPPATSGTGTVTEGTNAVVTRVVDGDTIEVSYRQRTIDVRLIGIDTAESVAPGEPVQCYAMAASRFTTSQLEGERVRLEFDIERIDRYGRTLAYVWLGDELFNEALVRGGYAFVTTYPPDVKYESAFLDAQRDARAHGRGVWGRCVSPSSAHDCDPSYPDVCIPPPPPDLDCSDVKYRSFTVKPPDPHHFDGNHDGVACGL